MGWLESLTYLDSEKSALIKNTESESARVFGVMMEISSALHFLIVVIYAEHPKRRAREAARLPCKEAFPIRLISTFLAR